jgi:6-phosphogluconate dehydrogenase
MDMLDTMADTVQPDTSLPLVVPAIASDIGAMVPGWRRTVAAASGAGYPVPVLGATLAYIEALGTAHLPTAMVQAQRDRFGAHGFGRTDRGGQHHGPWTHPDGEDGA